MVVRLFILFNFNRVLVVCVFWNFKFMSRKLFIIFPCYTFNNCMIYSEIFYSSILGICYFCFSPFEFLSVLLDRILLILLTFFFKILLFNDFLICFLVFSFIESVFNSYSFGLLVFFFSYFFVRNVLIWGISSFVIHAYSAVSGCLNTALAACHIFWYVVLSFFSILYFYFYLLWDFLFGLWII